MSSFSIGLKDIDISSVKLEWRSHEPKTKRRVPIMTEKFLVIARNELMMFETSFLLISGLPTCLIISWRVSNIPLISKGENDAFIEVCWLLACLTSQQHASVSQGRICTDKFTCCRTETEVADPIFYLTQSQYTDTGPTSPSADSIMPGAWQGSHWSANFEVTGMTRPRKNPGASGIRTRDLPLSRRTP